MLIDKSTDFPVCIQAITRPLMNVIAATDYGRDNDRQRTLNPDHLPAAPNLVWVSDGSYRPPGNDEWACSAA